MKYIVNITFNDGDKAEIKCEAKNQAAALSRIANTKQFIDFADGKNIESININVDTNKEPEFDYILQPSTEHGWWVVTDKTNQCVVKFKEKNFNQTAKITFLNDTSQNPVLDLATILRKIGDWVAINHKEIV